MSNSYRKTSITGICCADSEKQDKRKANRKLRRNTKQRLMLSDAENYLPQIRDVSNIWCMSKDGKMYFNSKKHPNLMRK